ncbi:MAG: PD40 domain-containing protein [Verrucomicrobia bacterium]|nr:PD40 domain-containing protein [Verrucomicrobiota bacterium]
MTKYKIFISSPGDVGQERNHAKEVIRRIAAEFQDRVEVQPYFWEYEPMEATRDYQENIPPTSDFDLVICILWKRLGSPLSVKHQRPGGGRWNSGTEFELVTALEAKKKRGVPDIFILKNDTEPLFDAKSIEKARADLDQLEKLRNFITDWCEGVQEGQRVFKAAVNRYQALDQFEQVLEKLLAGKLDECFPPAPDAPNAEPSRLRLPVATWTQGSPFRGLEAFQFAHAPVFCGRTRAIGKILDQLRRKAARPFVLILGASGSGKSSLAMAGVLPLLVKPGTIEGVALWRRVVFRPGAKTEAGDLFERLAAALVRREQEGEGLPELVSGSTSLKRLADDLRADPKAAALLVRSALDQAAALNREAEAQKLRGWLEESRAENRVADVERYGRLLAELKPRPAQLALVIDQAEELFTSDELNRRPELRAAFAVALDALAASGVVYVLATLRSDFYAQLQQLPAFVDLKDADGQYDLLPAQPAEIAQMIRQPALAAGLRFEKDPETQEGLDEALADQVKAEPRLLPLLEFALDELYKQRTADGVLTFEAYRVRLDASIVRALAKRADATLAGLPEASREAFRSVMRRLATTVDGTAAASANGQEINVVDQGASGWTFQRQRVPYDQLAAYPPGAKGLVDAFVAARLLVVEAGKAEDQKAEITVAHEALFEHWAALKNLLLAERDDLILPRARVAASYERWRAQHRAGDFLLPAGKQLSEAEHLLAKYGEELTPDLKAYIAASVAQAHAQQKRRQRLLVGALVVFALLAIAASGAAIFGYWQKGEAEKAASEARTRLVQSLVNSGRGLLSTNTDFDDLGSMVAVLRAERNLRDLKASPELRADARGALQRVVYGIKERNRLSVGDEVHCARFSRDGTRIAAVDGTGKIYIWNRSGRRLAEFQGPSGRIDMSSAAFTADLDFLITIHSTVDPEKGSINWDSSRALVWDVNEHRQKAELKPLGGDVWAADIDPGGRYIATAGNGGLRIWNLQGVEQKQWGTFPERAIAVAFSPDGKRLAWGSNAGVRILDLDNPGKVSILISRTPPGIASGQEVWGLAFRPGHDQMVAAGQLWDLKTSSPIAKAEGAIFSADREWVGRDSNGTPEIANFDGKRIALLTGHKEGGFVQGFGPGCLILTAGRDKTLRIWDLSDRFAAEFKGWRSTFSMESSETPRVYATCDTSYESEEKTGPNFPMGIGRDNAITLWSQDGRVLGEFPTHPGNRSPQFSLSPDATMLAVCYETSCRLWNTKTRQSKDIQLHGKMIGIMNISGKPALVSVDGVGVWAQDGSGLASSLFSLPAGTTSIEPNTGRTRLVAASPSGVSVWDLSGQRVGGFEKKLAAGSRVLPGSDLQRVGISEPGKVSTESGKVSIYGQDGKLIAAFGQVPAEALSPDGKLLATNGGFYAVATLWDVETKMPVARLSGNGDFQMRFTPDGKFVTVVGNDVPPRLWRVETTEELVTAACNWIGDYLLNNSDVSPEDRKLSFPDLPGPYRAEADDQTRRTLNPPVQAAPPAPPGPAAPAPSAASAAQDLILPPAAAASPRSSPAEPPVETAPVPEGGSDVTPQAAGLLAPPASNSPAPDDAAALEEDAGAAAPDAQGPRARGRHHHRPRLQPPPTFWQRLFGLFGHKETKPDKPRP